MSLSEACLRCLDFCWQHGFKAFFSLPHNPGFPKSEHCLDFLLAGVGSKPIFQTKLAAPERNQHSAPPHPPTPLAQVKLSKVRSWCVGPYLSIYLSILSIYLSILSVCQSVGRSVCLSVCRLSVFRTVGLSVSRSVSLPVCPSVGLWSSYYHLCILSFYCCCT